ncbi:MAG: 30S ribosomal protein S16 [Candidatus Omnitrophica bacterium]|nr:30S ribosomal protein S16 [Candidatus Omnitrophota bacterium]
MAVKIRLKRFGTKNRLQWRIVVSDIKMPRDGRFIEEIGHYDPLPANEILEVKKDRLEYWLKQGAQMSNALRSLLKRKTKKEKKEIAH